MKINKTTAFIVSITLLVSSASIASNKIDDIAEMPITGVAMIQTGERNILMSKNGRFIFEGVYDTWNDKKIVDINDVRKFAQRIDINEFSKTIKDLYHYSYGTGEKMAAVFVDPRCGYCSKLMKEMEALSKEYTFKLLPVAVLGKESQLIINNISCLDDDAALKALMSHQYNDIKTVDSGCKKPEQLKTLATARIFGVTAVPYMISPNNIVRKGGFQTNGEFVNYLTRK